MPTFDLPMISQHADLPLPTRLGTYYNERAKYLDPKFQRQPTVWSMGKKQRLINSLLRGKFVEGPKIVENPDDAGTFLRVDGQQRSLAVFDFIDKKFKTGTNKYRTDPTEIYVYQNMRFDQLPIEVQKIFLNRMWTMTQILNVDTTELSALYRNLQNQVPLNPAEKLWTYTESRVWETAVLLTEHPIFRTIIHRSLCDRHNDFMIASFPLVLELMGGFGSLEGSRLSYVMGGNKDQEMTQELEERVLRRLDLIALHFDGYESHIKSEIVLMYQALLLLEMAGYDVEHIEKRGNLSAWMDEVGNQDRGLLRYKTTYKSLFSVIGRALHQKNFWLANFDTLVKQARLPLRKSLSADYAYQQTARMRHWMQHDELCRHCQKTIPFNQLNEHLITGSEVTGTRFYTCWHKSSGEQKASPEVAMLVS